MAQNINQCPCGLFYETLFSDPNIFIGKGGVCTAVRIDGTANPAGGNLCGIPAAVHPHQQINTGNLLYIYLIFLLF